MLCCIDSLGQEHRLEQLQHEHEESMRLKALKEERELSRMERKLQNAAATYIQYSWRKNRYLRRIRAQRDHAVRVITAFVRLQRARHKKARLRAAVRIQKQWRQHRQRTKQRRALVALARFIGALARARRVAKGTSATRIQRWLRSIAGKRKQRATSVLQRAWRTQLSKKKIAYCSKAYRHLKELQKLEHNAKILQRALGKRAVYCRLIKSIELARYPRVMAQSCSSRILLSPEALQQRKQQLKDALRFSKQLTIQETSVLSEMETLQTRLRESKAKLGEEDEKLDRFQVLEANRRSKDDSVSQQKLETLELQMRKEIRSELEKEFEATRRAELREKSKQQPQGQSGGGGGGIPISALTSGSLSIVASARKSQSRYTAPPRDEEMASGEERPE